MVIHPDTGAAQLIEVEELVEEVVRTIYKDVAKETPLFERFEKDYLSALGVPTEWLDAVRIVGETGFLELIDSLPQEASENLMKLANGYPVPRPSPTEISDPFSHPDAKRRFRIIDDDKDLLRQALDAPWEKWLVFLHPNQQELIEKSYQGPVRVSGGAGTGKTVVALHRSYRLAQENPQAKVLLTTYSTTLASRLKYHLTLLEKVKGKPLTNIRVDNLHKIAAELLQKETGQNFKLFYDKDLLVKLEQANNQIATGFPTSFLQDEWENVIDEQSITSWKEYCSASRAGRGTPLGARQKLFLWQAFEQVLDYQEQTKQMTTSQLCNRVRKLLAEKPKKIFDHVIADEIQDFGLAELKLLGALVPQKANNIFLCGDLGQRIYKQKASYSKAGLNIRGRSSILRLNYRTTEQIRRNADKLLPNSITNADGDTEERQNISLLTGTEPEIIKAKSVDDEIEKVTSWIQTQLANNYQAQDIAIFARTKQLLKRRAKAIADQLSIKTTYLNEEEVNLGNTLSLGTMHSAKGLEFRVVVILACDSKNLPLKHVLKDLTSNVSRQEFIEKERNLLYVASTRAREKLLISGLAPLSEFF